VKIRDAAAQEPEMIWEGRLHFGDEPGIYGDAAYTGLAAEFPVTLTKYEQPNVADDITLELTANEIKIAGPYPGHLVTIFGFEAIPVTNPGDPAQWKKVEVGQGRFKADQLSVPTDDTAGSSISACVSRSIQGCRPACTTTSSCSR
jgi:hypothetical protein